VKTRLQLVCRAVRVLALSLVAWTSIASPAQFSFGALGDVPYNSAEEFQLGSMIEEMNAQPLAFVIHVGDFKHARTDCSDALFKKRHAEFSRSHHAFVFIPGDNEWTDCIGGPQRREPLERLAKLREIFFSTSSTLGERALPVEQQKARGYGEHLRWSVENVLFATFNVPGPENHVQVPGESRHRTAAILEWMEETFRIAHDRSLPGVVLGMHGNIWTGRQGYAEILSALSAHARRFVGEILVVHGDTHRFRFDRPFARQAISNLRRLEVAGSPFAAWTFVNVTIENGRARFEATPGSAQTSSPFPGSAEP
jgi:hypothetical protein